MIPSHQSFVELEKRTVIKLTHKIIQRPVWHAIVTE